MGVLVPQAQAELAFWKGLVESVGREYYYAYRCSEYFEKTRYFPSFVAQEGQGLDVGCGCVSVFEPSLKSVKACDPLWYQYQELLPAMDLRCTYCPVITDNGVLGETLAYRDATFDWVACLNMIDHTPDSARMLSEIHRVLKPGGKLYFEVNFETGLAPPHYTIWNARTVDQYIIPTYWELEHSYLQPVPEHHQQRYWAEYRRS